ncbi:MAG: PQQ-dependent sugar dehydrogenase [Gemmatimonadota bacterium]
MRTIAASRSGLLLAAAAVVACGKNGGATDPPSLPAGGVRLVEVATVESPVDLTTPPGDPSRLFVAEQAGRVRVIRNGTLLHRPFLDLVGQITSGGERGLRGLAFHPQYATNGRFVVHFTDLDGDTRVVSYRVSTADPDVADPTTGTLVFATPQPFSNHNGGQVTFGPDGMLYLGLGDGGSGGDPEGNGQSLRTPLGKILRLRVSGSGQVSTPPDNPFIAQTGLKPEIWSYGLRNPWRFSFDRANGDLYIADVGQGAREEVDYASAASGAGRGANFGWNIMEGTQCFSPATGCNSASLTLPALDYDHSQGCSITGGLCVPGPGHPVTARTVFLQ